MKIEVFIPYFNHEKYILQTIASVDNCSNRNLDIVIKIVNDGSNYKNLIKKLDSKFFNLNIQVNDSLNIRSTPNRHRGIRSRYFIFSK
jgi:glycosyltransferase involved in cell wall biosynthesis